MRCEAMAGSEELSNAQASELVEGVSSTVKSIMSRPPFDSSHDFHHIERVLALTRKIAASEMQIHPEVKLSSLLITLVAILHDIGDTKYVLEPANEKDHKTLSPTPESIILAHGGSTSLASTVQLLVRSVSFSNELKYPDEIAEIVVQYPELAIIQDADRLDALGATGVARAFVFNGVRGQALEIAREIFDTLLLPRERSMKTSLGVKMAKERCDFLREFAARWDLEMSGQT